LCNVCCASTIPCQHLYIMTHKIWAWGSIPFKCVLRSTTERIEFTLSCSRTRVIGPLGKPLGHGVGSSFGGATSSSVDLC
jgi:hypothetical protein